VSRRRRPPETTARSREPLAAWAEEPAANEAVE
jgi:hypothetical protein